MSPTKNKATMEDRLKTIEKRESGLDLTESSNLAKLLLDSLKRGDQFKIAAILRVEEQLIVRAVQRLRKDVILELVKELIGLVKQNRNSDGSDARWLKHLIEKNSSILTNSPDLPELTNIIRQRMEFQESLKCLQGKIKYFLNQMNNTSSDLTGDGEILDSVEADVGDSDELEMYESSNEEVEESSEDDEELSE